MIGLDRARPFGHHRAVKPLRLLALASLGTGGNCRSRPFEPHKYATAAEQDAHLELLLGWVRDYYTRDGDLSLAAHQALFDAREWGVGG